MKNKTKLLASSFFLIGILPLLMGCNTTREASKFRLIMKDDYCVSNINGVFSEIEPSFNNPDSLLENDSLLSNGFSKKEILVANATGMIPVIKQLLITQNDRPVGTMIKGPGLQQRIQEQLLRVKSIFDELQSELSCETERTKRAAAYLDGYKTKRANNLTIAAMFAGSATTVVPVLVKSSKPQNTIVIGGAIVSAYLGAKLLQSGHNKVDFTYERNLLSDIWTDTKVSEEYPAFIWQLMNRKELNTGNNNLSLQQNIKKRWWSIELNGANTHTLELLFKKGGSYSEDDLQTRTMLLGQLETSVNLLSANVQSCLLSIQKKLVISTK
ncbi:hypothetical protein [Mucilaginibacter psychrotolerans]|uniref:Uncharacterized protein n=1 Tax=Mucilaginibacter psychrotolerans TaxID=1524096 RepID=A0A4Y8S4D6_9SPHI|nr:hypothetical protein [Mucilaginibacter psychrotolerans]TFF33327.1 hypothetical protein E2R66_26375 [Mucilaginibacter psychrotolerans]